MTILNYKGYQGSIEYEDRQLIIQLLHIDDFITTICDSAGQAEAAFHELVDDYLATCAETGRAPDRPYKGSLNIRMSPELHRRAAMAAASAGVSLNAWIVRACEAATSKLGSTKHRAALSVSNQLTSPQDNIVDLPDLRRRNKENFDRQTMRA